MKTTIGDSEVYLAPDDYPEFEYSLVEVTDPSKVRGSRSTTFDVPASSEAYRVLGGRALNEEVASEQPFRIGEGSQILFEGVCTPVEWSDSRVTVAAFGDNAEWINAAKNTKCSEMDLGVTELITLDHIRDVWQSEEDNGAFSQYPYCFPLIDYGEFSGFLAGQSINEFDMRFGVQVSYLVRKFFADNGFSVKVEGELQRFWDKIMIPGLANNYRINDAISVVEVSTDTVIVSPANNDQAAIEGWRGFDTLVVADDAMNSPQLPLDNTYNSGGSYFTPAIFNRYVSVKVSIKARFRVAAAGGGAFYGGLLQVFMFRNVSPTANFVIGYTTISLPPINGTQEIDIEQELFVADVFHNWTCSVHCRPQVAGATVTILAGSQLTYEIVNVFPYSGVMAALLKYDIASALPSGLSVGDVISGITNIFRLSVQTNQLTNTVTFSTLDDYLRPIYEGIDWSDRIDETEGVVKVQPDNPISYRLRYTEDDKDELARDYNGEAQWTAQGIYDAGGRDDEKEIKVKFAATQQNLRFGVVIPVLKEEGSVEQYLKCKPRILLYDGIRDEGRTVFTWNGVARTKWPRAYFAGEGGTDINMGFGNDIGRPGTLQTFWRRYLGSITRPYLKADVRLYDDEFMDFAFGRPRLVHDGIMRSWVYVNKIKGKRFGDGSSVECELIPI